MRFLLDADTNLIFTFHIKFCSQKVAIVTFATFVYSDDKNILTTEKAFVALALFEIIRLPMALFPLVLVYMVEVFQMIFNL